MKKTALILSACIAIISLSECAKKNVPSKPATTPADEVAAVKAKYTPDQIAKGKLIYDNNCGSCHELKVVSDFTLREWRRILPDMVHKTKLSSDDAAILHAWVVTNAKQG